MYGMQIGRNFLIMNDGFYKFNNRLELNIE